MMQCSQAQNGGAAITGPEYHPTRLYLIDELPEEQRETARHVSGQIEAAAAFVREFADALGLFDYASARIRALTRRLDKLENVAGGAAADKRRRPTLDVWKLKRWQVIAARDGAMTIYHFFMTLSAIDEQLRLDCPDLALMLPSEPFKNVRKIRNDYFKDYGKVRHAVGHAAELRESVKHQSKNSLEGVFMFGQIIDERTFLATIGGKIVRYNVSHETLEQLRLMLTNLNAAFKEANKILQEMHYKRVYPKSKS